MRELTVKQPFANVRHRIAVDVSTTRLVGALALLSVFGWLVMQLEHHHHLHWQSGTRLAWSFTLLALVALVARGVLLNRPVTAVHAIAAVAVVATGLVAHLLSFDLLGDLVIAAAGLALMWPTTTRPNPEALPRVWSLINMTHGDPLAPFAMHSRKSTFFSADETAMLAYRTRMGFAVVGGDPIGNPDRFGELVRDFTAMCQNHGWRILVLGCSEHRLALWTDTTSIRPALRAIPFGRDVVIDVEHFAMVGRKYRNLRQAVTRTHNAGVTTRVVAEAELDDDTLRELTEVLDSTGVRTERGFSMILDGTLEGRYPGVQLIIARDREGRVQAFHRYVLAGDGKDVSLDVPWRRNGALNGIDERLTVDMVEWAKIHGARQLSLAFAAFPELFDEQHRGALQRLFYLLIHLGDGLIRLESLYRYLRKYHALAERRYVLVSMRQLLLALAVLLTLEFMPHRRRRSRRPATAAPPEEAAASGMLQVDSTEDR
jgi:lysylphosphatidylglycerol synthetase-like protein (DUF2156 family)